MSRHYSANAFTPIWTFINLFFYDQKETEIEEKLVPHKKKKTWIKWKWNSSQKMKNILEERKMSSQHMRKNTDFYFLFWINYSKRNWAALDESI